MVSEVGGGSPTPSALCMFFKTVDNDPEWYPGKHGGAKRGRKPLLTAAKRRCIARSAMTAKKKHGDEPCVAAVIHACPLATLNPETQLPFCDKTIRKVFAEDCYDFDPACTWSFQTPLQKVFLPDAVKAHRLRMANHLLAEGRDAAWFSRHVVWFDPCASIIPGSQRQYDLMRQACKRRKRWMSDDAKLYSPNLPGPPTALKQKGWEGRKVNWFVVLTMGCCARGDHAGELDARWRWAGKFCGALAVGAPENAWTFRSFATPPFHGPRHRHVRSEWKDR